MIQNFPDNLEALSTQFQTWWREHEPEVLRIGAETQQYRDTDALNIEAQANKKASDLAVVNDLIPAARAYLNQATALSTAKYAKQYPPMIVKSLAKGDTLLYQQAHDIIERLSASIVHQMDGINSRIWLFREQIKQGITR